MKLFAITTAYLFLSLCTYAQQSTDIKSGTSPGNRYPLPEFNNQPAYFNEESNALIELEKPKYYVKAKRNASAILTGIGKAGVYMNANIEKSPVRIKKKDTIILIMQTPEGKDPSTALEITACTSGKGKRMLLVSEVKTFQNAKNVYEKVPYLVKKMQDNVYFFVIPAIGPGEYFIFTDAGFFAFGVDN